MGSKATESELLSQAAAPAPGTQLGPGQFCCALPVTQPWCHWRSAYSPSSLIKWVPLLGADVENKERMRRKFKKVIIHSRKYEVKIN